MSDKKLELLDPVSGKKAALPVRSGTIGPACVDIAPLAKEFGAFTFDPGYGATAAVESKITYIDGEAGVLMHRGYPIEQLAAKSSFIEVCYLLLNGELPGKSQLDQFEKSIRNHTMINESLLRFFGGFHHNAHPMAMVSAVVASMSAFYHDSMDIHNPRHREIFAHRIVAKLPTIAAAAYKHSLGQPFVYPRNDLNYCANMLHMFFAVPCEKYNVDPVAAEALDLLFILHADHEQNCSTSTVRMVGSSQANLFASISAGVCALWGPLHGGANQKVIEMLERIRDDHGDYKKYVELSKDKTSNFRLMGFGHRVYKNFDPRARILKNTCDEVLAELGVKDPLLDIAKSLEEVALSDDFFIERKLYPNVDFYSGIIYRAMGIPTNMFTVMFALGRLPGWIAHWLEMRNDPNTRINRPRQIYTGATQRAFKPLGER